jgi:hypothetical protein
MAQGCMGAEHPGLNAPGEEAVLRHRGSTGSFDFAPFGRAAQDDGIVPLLRHDVN